ncbi:tape measure protein [Psychrobacter glaciei]|uniref:tape measure protein n=1 Tax=Psychrobacter glaciei TaxID=619771 RepID=UPI003F472BA2
MADLDYLINFDSNTSGIDKSKFAISKLGAAIAALGVGFGAKELANIADEYSSMAGRINIAVGETGNFEAAMQGVKDVSLATNSNLSATTQLFTKINDAGKELGMTQQQSLDLTKTITQAIQLGGGAASSNEAAIIQLTQALQSGVLRGDEFNSIMEQAPGISKALAASLGVTTGELRGMANEGKLSAQTVIQALQEQSAAIESDYEKLPLTINKALQKIQTQWAILIGEFDRDNGASSKVAEWISALGDGMGMLDGILADIGEGVQWVGDQIDGIDTQTIVAMKQAFESAYDALKSFATAMAEGFEFAVENLDVTLGMLFDFNSGLEDADSNTSGFTKAIQGLNVALGFISDGFAGITIASKLISGAFYDVAASFQQLKSNFVTGSWKEEAIANMEAMRLKAQEMYTSASDDALEFKSKGVAAIEDLKKTEEQVNAETLANLKETFADKTQAYQDFVLNEQNYAAQRIALEQQVEEARKTGSTARIAGLLKQLDEVTAKEEESAEKSIGFEQSKLAATQDYAQQAVDANNGVLDSATMLDLATQNYIATVNEAGQVSVASFNKIEGASNEAALSIKDIALNAAKGLGIDVNEALNKVSSGFDRNAEAVKRVADGYRELKAEGLNAGDLLSASLAKLLEGAKSQAEIDEVRRLYVQFGQDGKLATHQVEMGIDAINGKLEKSPALLDETARAFKELGIISQVEADKQAKAAIANYELVKKSGQANAGQLSEALDGIYGKIKTSGDSTLQTWYNNQDAALGFKGSLDAVEQSATRATVAIRENTAARKEQSTSTWNAKFANDANTKSESASLAIMQQVTAGIKDKISALNQLSGTTDTTDESYQKLMRSMGFVDGYKWLSMADYGRDMERVQAAVDKQAESYSAKNNKRHRGSSGEYTSDAMPDTKQYAPTSSSAPVRKILVELKSSAGSVDAEIPVNQESLFKAFLKQLQDSKSLAGQ